LESGLDVFKTADLLAVDFQNHVAFDDSGFGGGSGLVNFGDDQPAFGLHLQAAGDFRRERL
jgi:hypothetical protein